MPTSQTPLLLLDNLLDTIVQYPLATLIPLNPGTKTASVQLKLTALSPTDLVDDLTGGALKPVTNLVGTAGGLVGSITGLFGNQLNIGVTVDSVMVDPYRRG